MGLLHNGEWEPDATRDQYTHDTFDEDIATDLLAEHMPDRRLETNVEFYTAILLDGVGISKDLFTPTFAISRVGGWMIHALEQLDDNRLIRPTSHYIGDTQRS